MKPQLSHVGIYCHDSDAMISYYQDVLGLTVTDRGMTTSAKQPIAFMSSNVTQHHQFVLVQGRAKDAPSTINQLSFMVESLDELRAVANKATANGGKLRVKTEAALPKGLAASMARAASRLATRTTQSTGPKSSSQAAGDVS